MDSFSDTFIDFIQESPRSAKLLAASALFNSAASLAYAFDGVPNLGTVTTFAALGVASSIGTALTFIHYKF